MGSPSETFESGASKTRRLLVVYQPKYVQDLHFSGTEKQSCLKLDDDAFSSVSKRVSKELHQKDNWEFPLKPIEGLSDHRNLRKEGTLSLGRILLKCMGSRRGTQTTKPSAALLSIQP